MNEDAKKQLKECVEKDRALKAVFGPWNRVLSTLVLFGEYVHEEKRKHWRLPASSPDGRRGINLKTFLTWVDENSEKFTGTEIEKAKRDMEILRVRHPVIGQNNILHRFAEKLDDAGVIEKYSNQNPYTIVSAYREAMGFAPPEETPREDTTREDDRLAGAQKPIARDKESPFGEAKELPTTALSGGVLNVPETSVDEELDLEEETRITAETNVEGTEVMPEGEPLAEEDVPTEGEALAEEDVPTEEEALAEGEVSGRIEETITAEEEVTDVPVGIENLVAERREEREESEINLSDRTFVNVPTRKERSLTSYEDGTRTLMTAPPNRLNETERFSRESGEDAQRPAKSARQQYPPPSYQGDRSGSGGREKKSNLAKKLAKIAGGVGAGIGGACFLGMGASASAMCLEILIK